MRLRPRAKQQCSRSILAMTMPREIAPRAEECGCCEADSERGPGPMHVG